MILRGDCLETLKTLESNSVDSVVTDPPYGLKFMGKKWDYEVPSVKIWKEVLRVLKPGGHILAACGTRTQHRMAVNIEDAGFEVRDVISYHYGSGFPKSLNVYKSAAKAGLCCTCEVKSPHVSTEDLHDMSDRLDADDSLSGGTQSDMLESVFISPDRKNKSAAKPKASKACARNLPHMRKTVREKEVLGQANGASLLHAELRGDSTSAESNPSQRKHEGTPSQGRIRTEKPSLEGRGDVQANKGKLHRTEVCPMSRSLSSDVPKGRLRHGSSSSDGKTSRALSDKNGSGSSQRPQYAKQSDSESRTLCEQRPSQTCGSCGKTIVDPGLGTALKPATEFWTLARKPIEGTVAQNVLKYGCGGLNIDATRIGSDTIKISRGKGFGDAGIYGTGINTATANTEHQGRFPANVIFDEEAGQALDAQTSYLHASGNKKKGTAVKETSMFGIGEGGFGQSTDYGDSGGASRFFYCAKASKSERNAGLDKNDLVWEKDAWQKRDLNSLTESISQLAKATSGATLLALSSWNIERSGLKQTDQSQRATTFITSTVSKLITALKTSNASQSLNTRESILGAIRTLTANGLSLAESAEIIGQSKQNSTSAKTVSALGVVHAALLTLQQISAFGKSGNFHSTVKPLKLMQYLIKLITPEGGVCLDPFMGSGTTGVACKSLGFEFIGCELSNEYAEIAERRIEAAV